MSFKNLVAALAIGLTTSVSSLAMTAPATAEVFRFASQGDLKSYDPYALAETFSLAMIGNVYEGLVSRDLDLKIIPSLAESWEVSDDARKWTFNLLICARV